MLHLKMSVLLSVLAGINAFSTPEEKADAPPLPPWRLCGPDDNADDCTALVAFNHGRTLDWKMDGKTPLCTWFGVTCSDSTKRVEQLSLVGDQIGHRVAGFFPSEVGYLTAMTRLDISQNFMIGSIPSEVGLLTSMTSIDLDQNSLSGAIPSEVGLLTAMTGLRLADNDLSGAIPSEVGLLTAMTEIDLSHNSLSGAVPSEICNLHLKPPSGGASGGCQLFANPGLDWQTISAACEAECN